RSSPRSRSRWRRARSRPASPSASFASTAERFRVNRSREIQLAARPNGEPKPDDFRLAEAEVPDPEAGQLLVRNRWMSVDPYMRGRMNDVRSYVPPFQLDAPLEGGAVGEVLKSGDERFAEGQWVLHQLGWRELALTDAQTAQ